MPRQEARRPGPWLGSVVLHLVFVALLGAAAVRWRSDVPPPQLAIEGNVVRYEDLPPSVKSGRPLREPVPEPVAPPADPAPTPAPAPEPEPEVVPEPPAPDPGAAEAAREAEAQRREQEREAHERQQAEDRAARERQAAETQRRQQAADEKRRAEAEARRKADEQKQRDELEARQKRAEQEKSAREARSKAEREAELKRALASEEEGEAIARSGVVDEYRAMLIQTIERNWNRPPSARAGLECTLYVTQATGGTVIDVKIGECNGDQAVRESVANAVYRSSPLPPPRDARAFERRLVMVFKPTE